MAYRVVGKPVPRVDGREETTGSLRYAWDVTMPGMLWARVLRSPQPHARIVRIDTSRAEQMPGVHAVLTGQNVTGRRQAHFPAAGIESVLVYTNTVPRGHMRAPGSPQVTFAAARAVAAQWRRDRVRQRLRDRLAGLRRARTATSAVAHSSAE